eukprot:COSAG02_NODE_6143_length_3770_cov_8.101335_3_plen_133_part_00
MWKQAETKCICVQWFRDDDLSYSWPRKDPTNVNHACSEHSCTDCKDKCGPHCSDCGMRQHGKGCRECEVCTFIEEDIWEDAANACICKQWGLRFHTDLPDGMKECGAHCSRRSEESSDESSEESSDESSEAQ